MLLLKFIRMIDQLFQTRIRKPRKPREMKNAITKEIVEENDSSDENKKPKPKADKVSFKRETNFLDFINLYEINISISPFFAHNCSR